jgi:hypothetical protein
LFFTADIRNIAITWKDYKKLSDEDKKELYPEVIEEVGRISLWKPLRTVSFVLYSVMMFLKKYRWATLFGIFFCLPCIFEVWRRLAQDRPRKFTSRIVYLQSSKPGQRAAQREADEEEGQNFIKKDK